MAGVKRGAVEVVGGTRALRRRDAPVAVAAAATLRGAVAGGKRGTRAVSAAGRDGRPVGTAGRQARLRVGRECGGGSGECLVLWGCGFLVCGDPGGVVRGALV